MIPDSTLSLPSPRTLIFDQFFESILSSKKQQKSWKQNAFLEYKIVAPKYKQKQKQEGANCICTEWSFQVEIRQQSWRGDG